MVYYRELTVSDIDEILSLGIKHEEFQCIENDFWQKEELFEWISSTNDYCFGAFDEQGLIGYCLSHVNIKINKVQIENIYVAKPYRKKGIAKALLNKVLNKYVKNGTKTRFVILTQFNNNECILLSQSVGFSTGEKMLWLQKNYNSE